LGGGAGPGAFLKNLRMPSFLVNCRSLSSSEGADDKSDDRSDESDILVVVVVDGGAEVVREKVTTLGVEQAGLASIYRLECGDEDNSLV
jgi:hypothetical protein